MSLGMLRMMPQLPQLPPLPTQETIFTEGLSWKAWTMFAFYCIAVFLLGLSLIPMPIAFHMFKTEFINMNNVSIEDFQGVTKILWGTWNACYYNANDHRCISKHWAKNPYTFVIVENGNQHHANVMQLWLGGLYIQFGAFLIILSMSVVLFFFYLHRKHAKDMQAWGSNEQKKTLGWIRILMLILIVVMVTIIVSDSFVFMSIQNGMQPLAIGGITSVKSTLGPGYMTVIAASAFLFISCVYVIIHANTQINPSNPRNQAQGPNRGNPVKQFTYLDW